MSVRVSIDYIKGTYTGFVTFLKFQNKLGVIMEWFSTKKKLYVFCYENWGFLMRNMNENCFSRRNLELFTEVIHTKGAPLDNCWSFLDGTTRHVCHPGQNQRLLYNGHKRYYCIKFQSVVAPNGLIGNLFGPVEGK